MSHIKTFYLVSAQRSLHTVCQTLTFLWQVLLDRRLRLLHVFIAGDVQLEDFQLTGTVLGQTLGSGSFWGQTPSKDHKPSAVQTLSQLVSEARVTACHQHSEATTVHHRAAAAAGHQLNEDEDEDSRDEDNADGVNGVHAGGAVTH